MTKKEKAKLVVEKLEEIYIDPTCNLIHEKPYELLIAIRLSAQCTDARVNTITPILFKKYDTLEKLATAEISDIQQIVKPCGLGKTKGKDIVMASRILLTNYNGVIPNSLTELLKLPGVGRKTANLIMGDIYNQPAIVADTHCIRISNRLGLCNSTDPYKVEMQLKKLVAPIKSNNFCHRLVLFGRDICVARSPKCTLCTFNDICNYVKQPKNKNKTTIKK